MDVSHIGWKQDHDFQQQEVLLDRQDYEGNGDSGSLFVKSNRIERQSKAVELLKISAGEQLRQLRLDVEPCCDCF